MLLYQKCGPVSTRFAVARPDLFYGRRSNKKIVSSQRAHRTRSCQFCESLRVSFGTAGSVSFIISDRDRCQPAVINRTACPVQFAVKLEISKDASLRIIVVLLQMENYFDYLCFCKIFFRLLI